MLAAEAKASMLDLPEHVSRNGIAWVEQGR